MKKLFYFLSFLSFIVTAHYSSFAFAAELTEKKRENTHKTIENQAQPKVLIIIGPPGSGKGTQSVQLSKKLGIPHISTGDLLRENVKNETPLGKEAKSFMDAGKLVPDSLVSQLLYVRIAQPDAASGYILDGYPRTVAQAKAFAEQLKDKAKILVVYLDINEDAVVQRILGRAKATQVARSDDTPAIIKERLKVYQEQTAPVVDYFKANGKFVRIDAAGEQQAVFEKILKAYRE